VIQREQTQCANTEHGNLQLQIDIALQQLQGGRESWSPKYRQGNDKKGGVLHKTWRGVNEQKETHQNPD